MIWNGNFGAHLFYIKHKTGHNSGSRPFQKMASSDLIWKFQRASFLPQIQKSKPKLQKVLGKSDPIRVGDLRARKTMGKVPRLETPPKYEFSLPQFLTRFFGPKFGQNYGCRRSPGVPPASQGVFLRWGRWWEGSQGPKLRKIYEKSNRNLTWTWRSDAEGKPYTPPLFRQSSE